MFCPYLAKILCQRPVRSGLPSAVRGAGAARFGLRSEVRGMPGAGYFIHCASSGVVIPQIANPAIINTQNRNLLMISASLILEDALTDRLHSIGSKNRRAFAAADEFDKRPGTIRSFGSRTNTRGQDNRTLKFRRQQTEKIYAWNRHDGSGWCNNKVDLTCANSVSRTS